MTAYGIVRTRVKAGREQELFDLIRQTPKNKGLRRNVFVGLGGNRYCGLLDWESYQDLVKGRVEGRKVMDAIRHLLVDMGGELGVTYAVSGKAIYEFDRADQAIQPSASSPRRFWSIVRYSLKRGQDGAIEAIIRAITDGPAYQATSLRKVAIVDVGARGFCHLSEWDSQKDLAVGNREMIDRLEGFRDVVETVAGGSELAHSISGEAVFSR